MNLPLLLVVAAVQLPLMVVFPIVIGLMLRRRYGVGWRIFLFGGATFVASQVVHLPLNYALGLISGEWGVALWPLLPMALVAGLSAGVCEQAARWVVLRFVLPGVRGWRHALQFGAGHGGVEAIILGLLVMASVVQMVFVQQSGIEALGLGSEKAAQALQMLQAFWGMPLYAPVLGGLERVFTVAFHVAMAVLVMRAVVHCRAVYWMAAVVAHTVYDGWAVWAMRTLGLAWTELGLAVAAAAGVWLIVRLREDASEHGP